MMFLARYSSFTISYSICTLSFHCGSELSSRSCRSVLVLRFAIELEALPLFSRDIVFCGFLPWLPPFILNEHGHSRTLLSQTLCTSKTIVAHLYSYN